MLLFVLTRSDFLLLHLISSEMKMTTRKTQNGGSSTSSSSATGRLKVCYP